MTLRSTLLDDLAPVIGFSATCALVAWWGGRKLYVPARYDPNHPLARVIGTAGLRRLCDEFGGQEPLKIPSDAGVERYRRDKQVCEDFAAGLAATTVAARHRMSVRRAEQLRAELVDRGWLAIGDAGALERQVGPKT